MDVAENSKVVNVNIDLKARDCKGDNLDVLLSDDELVAGVGEENFHLLSATSARDDKGNFAECVFHVRVRGREGYCVAPLPFPVVDVVFSLSVCLFLFLCLSLCLCVCLSVSLSNCSLHPWRLLYLPFVVVVPGGPHRRSGGGLAISDPVSISLSVRLSV